MVRGVVIILLCVVAFAAVKTVADDKALFETFKAKYNKQYATAEEEAKRFQLFQTNMAKAADMQAQDPEASYGMNSMSDLSEDEFSAYLSSSEEFASRRLEDYPVAPELSADEVSAAGDTIDWRAKGAVSYVRTQGNCGCCWAITTVQAAEGQWFLAGNPLPTLSTQQLVSCDKSDSACRSGFMTSAYDWLLRNRAGRIATEAAYPYVSANRYVPACSDTGRTTGAIITGYRNLPRSEAQMASYLYSSGPIGIAIDATSWHSYSGGVMANCRSGTVNHGVLLVGMGKTATGSRYWIVKNSWGPGWGEGGYIRVLMGRNACNIAHWPIIPTVSKTKLPTVAPKPKTPAPKTPAPKTPAPKTPAPKTPAPHTPVPLTPVPRTPVPRPPTAMPTNAPTTLPPVTDVPQETNNGTEVPAFPNATSNATADNTTTVDGPVGNSTVAPNATDANFTAMPSAPNATDVNGSVVETPTDVYNSTEAPPSSSMLEQDVETIAPMPDGSNTTPVPPVPSTPAPNVSS
jgi:C1A family cysteine protease